MSFVLFIVDFAATVRAKRLFAAVQNAEKMPAKRASKLYKRNRKRSNNDQEAAKAQKCAQTGFVYCSDVANYCAKQKYDR